MKRFALCLPAVLLLSGCAQVFQGNAFQAIDQPPALSASAIQGESDSTVVTQITSDSSFVKSLKSNPAALAAVQSVLKTGYTTSTSTTTVITDAQAYITATSGGSNAGAVVTSAMSQAQTLANSPSASSAATALTNMFAGQTSDQIQATLTQFQNMSFAFSAMQGAATSGSTVNSTTFYGSAPSKLNVAVTAALAASVNAFVAVNGGGSTGLANLSQALASGTSFTTTGGAVDNLTAALSGTGSDPNTNQYAYLATVKSLVNT